MNHLVNPMKTILPEAVFPTTLYPPRQGRRPIAIGALLVTGWLSTAIAAPVGADRQAPTKPPGSHGLESQAPESQTLRLRFDDGLLSLHASQRPFEEVLGAIQKETGIRFHYTIPMSGTVTLSFNDLPVQEALKRFLGREAQLMFRFPEGPGAASSTGVPEEVWILGEVSGPVAIGIAPSEGTLAKHAAPGVAGVVAPTQAPETPAPADEPQPEADPATSELPDVDSLIETTGSEDPTLRLQALSALVGNGKVDPEAVESALDSALTDEDPGVRAQAVQALMRRGGAEATAMLGQALNDRDPAVRLEAVDTAVPDDQGVALLKQALADTDETVQYRAAMKLKEAGIPSPGLLD